jgi:hypothetical protein
MPIMQEKFAIAIAGMCFSQLLQGPFSRRVFGDIEMYDSSGSDLEGNEQIKDTEAYRHRNEEVASDHPVCLCAWFRMKVDQR